MALEDIPLFAVLKANLSYNNQRQTQIARNVANADTPGFKPNDLKPFSVNEAIQSDGAKSRLQPLITNAGHLTSIAADEQTWAPVATPDSEVRLDGNGVVLEEQMMKLNDAEGDFVTGIGFYQRSLQLLHSALKKPGS